MTTINFTGKSTTSAKFAEKKAKDLAKILGKQTPPQKNIIENFPTGKEFGKRFLEFSKKTEAQKATTDDLLFSLEEQIRLEPQNIELRKAYDAIKSSL